MKGRTITTAVLALALTLPIPIGLGAQQANPITASLKSTHDTVRGYITRSAEQFPEDQYGFQATKEVRTFGQLLGHIANANYLTCGATTGQKGPGGDIEKTATTKAALQRHLPNPSRSATRRSRA